MRPVLPPCGRGAQGAPAAKAAYKRFAGGETLGRTGSACPTRMRSGPPPRQSAAGSAGAEAADRERRGGGGEIRAAKGGRDGDPKGAEGDGGRASGGGTGGDQPLRQDAPAAQRRIALQHPEGVPPRVPQLDRHRRRSRPPPKPFQFTNLLSASSDVPHSRRSTQVAAKPPPVSAAASMAK